MKASPKNHSRKATTKPSQKAGTPGEFGNLSKAEKLNLVLQAKDAFEHQKNNGRVEPGQSFDEWRSEMVMGRVGKAGISKINRSEFREVKAMFLELAGKEDEAFKLLMKTGQKGYRPKGADDTFENSETYVALITQEIENHVHLAETSEADLEAEWRAEWAASQPRAQYPGPDERALACKRSIAEFGKGPITASWLLTAARQRAGMPSLTMENMADRLDPQTLVGLLAHVRNHIALREGRSDPDKRAPRRA